MRFFIATIIEKKGRVVKRQIQTDRADITQTMIIQSVMILHNQDAVESIAVSELKQLLPLPVVNGRNAN